MRRPTAVATAILSLGLLLGPAANADAAGFANPKCTNAKLTNAGSKHRTCITTARHYRTRTKAWPVVNKWDATNRCHVSYWLAGSKIGPTKGEAFRVTCWEKGKFNTYYI